VLTFWDELLEKFSNGLVESFRKVVSGWIVGRRRHTSDFELAAESLERLADELKPIIMDNPSWHAKVIDYMMFDKLDHVRCLHLLQRGSLRPFGEVIKDKINWYPLDEGGLIGPTTSIPHILNGQEEVAGWRCPGAWWMKSPWIWQVWHRLA